MCKFFGPKIRSCKFFDKSPVWEGKAFGWLANISSLILKQAVWGTWLFSATSYGYSGRLTSNQGRNFWEARKYHHYHHYTDHHHHPPRMGTRGKILWEAALGGGGSGSQRLGSRSSPEYVWNCFIFSSVFLNVFLDSKFVLFIWKNKKSRWA